MATTSRVPASFSRSSPATKRRSIPGTRSRKWAAGHGFKGVQMPSLGRPAVRPEEGGVSPRPTATSSTASPRENGVEITELGTHLQGQLVAVHPAYDEAFDAFAPEAVRGHPKAAAEVGGAADAAGRPRRRSTSGLKSNVSFPGALAWPYLYPWPQRPRRPDRDRLRRAGQALEADPRRLRRGRLQRRLRAPSGRGPVRRRHLRDVPRAGRQPSALLHQLRPVALRAAAARLSRVHRHLSRAHQVAARQGRRVPTRRAGRASTRATSRGSTGQGGSARSATARSTSARSSRSWRSTATTAGRCWSGSAA